MTRVSVWRFDYTGWVLDPIARFVSRMDAQEYIDEHHMCIITGAPRLTISDIKLIITPAWMGELFTEKTLRDDDFLAANADRVEVYGALGEAPQLVVRVERRIDEKESRYDPRWYRKVKQLALIVAQQQEWCHDPIAAIYNQLAGIRKMRQSLSGD